MMKLNTMRTRLDGLVIFRGILQANIVPAFRAMLAAAGSEDFVSAAADFENQLFERGGSWTRVLLDAVLQDENICIRKAASGGAGQAAARCMDSELEFLQQLSRVTLVDLTGGEESLAFLPRWETEEVDFAAAYAERLAEVGQKGYGMFARHHMFTIEDGSLIPVRFPDPQRLSELPGYEHEREKVIANTKALLSGKPAVNVLLYGDAGTGKSSSVKAIANEFAADGLRLVEVKKNQLYQIPALLDSLAQNPLKFILFIDDLSFSANDDNFAALKAILEGSVGGRSQNVVVYATSNRRHLIKETLSDRSGDDIHEADTRQELMSLSARFGLTVTFQRPDKVRFEEILLDLAKQYEAAVLGRNRAAYQGVEGAFAHIALKALFPHAEAVSYSTWDEVFEAVAVGEAAHGVVPFENSHAGDVSAVLDLCYNHPELWVVDVYDLPISQNLLVLPGTQLSQLRTVYSHQQAIAQSETFLKQFRLPATAMANTAMAAKFVAESGDASKAAIASAETAALYGLEILVPNINTDGDNTTRFIVLSREKPTAGNRFSLLFTVDNKPGKLAEGIQVIGASGFNMESIKSRPMPHVPFEYYFYVELVGDAAAGETAALLRELDRTCRTVRLLGVYTK